MTAWTDFLGAPTTLPHWIVLGLGVLSALAILDHVLLPAGRAVVRWRSERRFERLNTQLRLRLQSFKMTRRRVLIDRLLHDPEVLAAVEQQARETDQPLKAVMKQARGFAAEIVPSFSAYTYFRIGTRLSRWISRSLYRVRLGVIDRAAMDNVPVDASVVFVINHRSNMDYVLVTYMVSTASALSYAVGEWAQVWGLRELIRSMGAYFIRRNSRDPLYRKVLARYVDMATKAGVVQAVFPEGGLSRTGAMQPAKLGLLSYMVSGFDPHGTRDIVFIPVGVNYDRVLEDRILLAAASAPAGTRPRFGFNGWVFACYMGRQAWLRITGRWHRYGYACVGFGKPLSLKAMLAPRALDYRAMPPDERHAEIEALGERLMAAIARVVPAVPVPLAALALLEADERGMTAFELKGRVHELIEAREAAGMHVYIPRGDRDFAVESGLRALRERRLITLRDGAYQVNADARPLLQYYANSLVGGAPGGSPSGSYPDPTATR